MVVAHGRAELPAAVVAALLAPRLSNPSRILFPHPQWFPRPATPVSPTLVFPRLRFRRSCCFANAQLWVGKFSNVQTRTIYGYLCR